MSLNVRSYGQVSPQHLSGTRHTEQLKRRGLFQRCVVGKRNRRRDADSGHFGVPPVGSRSDRNGFYHLGRDLQKLRSSMLRVSVTDKSPSVCSRITALIRLD